jgi:outer membrane protein
MKTIKIILLAAGTSAIVSAAGLFLAGHLKRTKIAYVRSGMILSEYSGMAEANKKFESEIGQVRANLDTLKNRYERLLAGGKASGSTEDKLSTARNELEKYAEQSDRQMQARRDELTGGILQEVNSFIQEYGKKHNYRLILGTTNDGSILYGDEADDLTEEIIKELNERRNGRNKKDSND